MKISHWIAQASLAAAFLLVLPAYSQTAPCPAMQGVYALKDSQWIEMPSARANKEKLRTGFPYHGVAIAVYDGAASTLELYGNVTLCVSGAPLGSSFLLARAKEKKKTREVKVGTYSVFASTLNFAVDKNQVVSIEQTQDKNRAFVLHSSDLSPGQYILFMQQGSSLSSIPPAFDFAVQ